MISDLLLGEPRLAAGGSDGAGMELVHGSSMESPFHSCQAFPNDIVLGKTLQLKATNPAELSMQTFGQRLRHARDSLEITQEELGFEVGVSKASISAWENDRERPSFDNLPKLQAALRRSLDDLIVGSPQEQQEDVREDPAEWLPQDESSDDVPISDRDDLTNVVEAVGYCQTFLMQALAATIPTAAVDVLGALDNKLPRDLHEIGYIQVLRKAILGQLSRNSMLSRRAATAKAPAAPQRKRR